MEGELVAGDADGFNDGCADVLKRGVFQQVDQRVADDFGADAAVFGGTGAVGNDSDEVGAAGGPAAAVLTELAAAEVHRSGDAGGAHFDVGGFSFLHPSFPCLQTGLRRSALLWICRKRCG